MIELFNKKNQPMLGIDISASSVKVVEIYKEGNRYHLERFATVAVPQNAVVDKVIVDSDAVAESIKKAIKNSKTKLKHACIAVPASSVITKTVQMPKDADDKEIGERIYAEADQYIPYSLNEVSIDYTVIGENRQDNDKNNVLLVAARREMVDSRVETLLKAGLTPKIVDVETFAIENAFSLVSDQIPSGSSTKVIAIVDIGSTSITLTVFENGRTVYTREQGGGGRELTLEIEKRYGLGYDEAEVVKKTGGLPDNYFTDVLEPFKNKTIQIVSRSMQFFMSSAAHKHIDCIVLMGGCASVLGLVQQTESMLGVKTFLANPFMNMQISKKIDVQSLSPQASSYLIACGLAMRGCAK